MPKHPGKPPRKPKPGKITSVLTNDYIWIDCEEPLTFYEKVKREVRWTWDDWGNIVSGMMSLLR